MFLVFRVVLFKTAHTYNGKVNNGTPREGSNPRRPGYRLGSERQLSTRSWLYTPSFIIIHESASVL